MGVYLKDMVVISDCMRLVVVNEGLVVINLVLGIFSDFEGLVMIIVRND